MIHTTKHHKPWQWLLVLSLLCAFILPAQAAIPDNVDYQGYLTDSGGSPINGTLNITFSLYNIDSGGIALWSDAQSVIVKNGLFNIKLGRAGNPFPIGLFDTPLWLSTNVESDGEMLPRTALSSSAFAHKADDADSVGGVSIGNLLQSSDLTTHTADASAHHNKTTSFSELSGQAADAQIPATVTRDTELNSHTGNTSAHHPRYTDAEARFAMGPKADFNPLHHDKRNEVQVFAAVTSQDGAGSTLDADMLDGLQANEIIDAAQDEVRTPISSLPFTISAPGSYYLTGNLDGAGGGIDIAADNVTLDLMGFTMEGGASDHGIDIIFGTNIRIKNGSIVNFGNAGIHAYFSQHVTLIDIRVMFNGGDGIFLGGENNHIERCVAADNGQHGIFVGGKSRVINNTVFNNVQGIVAGMGVKLTGNTAYNNMNIGIAGDSGSTITGNIVYENDYIGISGGSGSTVSGNTVYNNFGAGIIGESGSAIIGNTTHNNMSWGIFGVASNSIRDNTVHNNSIGSWEGGIHVGSYSRVVANTLDKNDTSNIYVEGTGNVIEGNSMANSADGMRFTVNGNFYADNRVTATSIPFNLGGTTQTDGGGNVSF